MSSRVSDNALAEAEDALREAGFNYPIAWALGFIVDNESTLVKALLSYDKEPLAKQVKRLSREIRTGVLE